MSDKSTKNEKYCDALGNKIPRNRNNYLGGVLLYHIASKVFVEICFGTGDNLDSDDRKAGYDEYIMITLYRSEPTYSNGDGITFNEIDGAQLVFNKRKRNCGGDIRNLIVDGLEMAGYSNPSLKDVVYINRVT